MKVVSALRRRCKDCKIVRRKKKIFVKCETNPKHKQRQGFCTWMPISESITIPKIADQYLNLSATELLVLNNYCSTLIR